MSDIFIKTCRFIIAYNKTDILGICKFAYFELSKHHSISYLSTNNDFKAIGVSKKLLNLFFKYFSESYPNKTLYFSGYSIDGWKYLRKYILEYSKIYSVKIIEHPVHYPSKAGYDDEFFDLIRKSKKEISDLYGTNEHIKNNSKIGDF